MKLDQTLPVLAMLILALTFPLTSRAQYEEESADTTRATPDTVAKARGEQGEEVAPATGVETTPSAAEEEKARLAADATLNQASSWVRRLLFRGELDATHIGAYAQYQLTPWEHGTGSYGPVEARLTVYYLGTTLWRGKDAEWLQAVFQSMDDQSTLIEFDLIVSVTSKIDEMHRVLYRVDRGEVKVGNFTLPPDQLDYDRVDRPVDEGNEELRFYSGTYPTQVLRGSGTGGAEVVIYRTENLPPMNTVVLGYGNEALTYIGGGNDGSPRFRVPPPPGR